MEIMTISEVSKQFGVSTRMLRYYEKAGLLSSGHIPDYSYRVYDEEAVKRLQKIIVLRKLRIPLKQIFDILNNADQVRMLEILQENLAGLDEEIAALTTVKDILGSLVSRLGERAAQKAGLDLLEDTELMEIVRVLNPPKTTLKEEHSMSDLEKAEEVLESKMDIRIVYLPPATVASYRNIAVNPEDEAGARIYSFIRERKLTEVKPDFRLYGFNNPCPQEGQKEYGYEFWVTIPDDMEVKKPFVKKKFDGGLYAAHCIKMGNFEEWGTFMKLLENHEEYEIQWREPYGMGGCLEEELNIFMNIQDPAKTGAEQLDLLIPIRKRER